MCQLEPLVLPLTQRAYPLKPLSSRPTILMHSPYETTSGRLTEAYVQDAFHSYLKSSLAQARAEKLIDLDMLTSAEGDLMITGSSSSI